MIADLFGFLTTEPNADVGPVHPKVMPVISITPKEGDAWMTAPSVRVLALQQPLPDGALIVVIKGEKQPAPAEKAHDGLLLCSVDDLTVVFPPIACWA